MDQPFMIESSSEWAQKVIAAFNDGLMFGLDRYAARKG